MCLEAVGRRPATTPGLRGESRHPAGVGCERIFVAIPAAKDSRWRPASTKTVAKFRNPAQDNFGNLGLLLRCYRLPCSAEIRGGCEFKDTRICDLGWES